MRHNTWEIRAGYTSWDAEVLLNGEPFPVVAVDFSLRINQPTQLTVKVLPQRTQILTDPELTIVVDGRRFRVIEEIDGL